MKHNPSYSQLIIKVTNTKDINPETFLSYNHNKKIEFAHTTQGINSDFFAHFEELVSEHGIQCDLFLVLDSECFEVRLEVNHLFVHLFELSLLDLCTQLLLFLLQSLILLDACYTRSTSHLF